MADADACKRPEQLPERDLTVEDVLNSMMRNSREQTRCHAQVRALLDAWPR